MTEILLKRLNAFVLVIAVVLVTMLVVSSYNNKSGIGEMLGGGGVNYGFNNASSTVYSNLAGKAVVLTPANKQRGAMVITNMTATVAYISLNATTTPNTAPILADTKYTILVPASGSYTFSGDMKYNGAMIATSSAACTFRVTELY